MKILEKIKSYIKAHRKHLTASLIAGLALFLACYFMDNCPYSFGGPTSGQIVERIKNTLAQNSDYFRRLWPVEQELPDELLLVNIAYDNELAEHYDETGFFPVGTVSITDRSKLLWLLDNLKDADYKYIVLDIMLGHKYHSDADSALFGLIASMPNIVTAKAPDNIAADTILAAKACDAHYSINYWENNFVKYEFLDGDNNSMPYRVYTDLHDKKFCHGCGFYFFNGRLANRSIVLPLPYKLWADIEADDTNIDYGSQASYYNLGYDFIEGGMDVASAARDKIVIVGDFAGVNDMHETYLGNIAGPVLHLNAYYALVNDKASLPWLFVLLYILITAAATYWLLERKPFVRLDLNKIKWHFLRFLVLIMGFVLSLLGTGVAITVIAAIIYILFGIDINLLVPTFYFTVLISYIDYKYEKQN